MTKAELLKEFDKLEKEKGVRIEGIYCNSKKSTIENAIECLKCPDELLNKYLTVVSLKYPNSGRGFDICTADGNIWEMSDTDTDAHFKDGQKVIVKISDNGTPKNKTDDFIVTIKKAK